MKHVSCCLLLFSFTFLFGQKEGNMWYFGQKAGLDFNSGSPVPLTNGQLYSREGCASIADRTTGQILFYTDGDTVWDKSHTEMQNGTGLGGNKSTTQTAVMIPAPGSDTLYYVFAIDPAAGLTTNLYAGLAYNIIDITLNGGKGAVILKNQPLVTPTTEKLCAVRHANGRDVWVMTHLWSSDAFYAYLVTPTGIQSPVITNIGITHTDIPGGWSINYETLGYMKFSPNGKKLAVAICNNLNKMQLFDFDNSTGVVSNLLNDNIAQPNSFVGPYGISFSPDNSKLYLGVIDAGGSNASLVYQYDLSSANNASIIASKTLISSQTSYGIGALQIGPDGRIYVAKTNWNGAPPFGSDYLDVIQCPNAKGTDCNYAVNSLFLGGSNVHQSTLGLSGIMESFLFTPDTALLSYTSSCQNDTVVSFQYATHSATSFAWNFNDPASGTANTSTEKNPTHTFSSTGTYPVRLIISSACKADTVTQLITVTTNSSIPAITGNDTLCQLEPATLKISTASGPFQWQSSSTGSGFTDIAGATDTVYTGNHPQTTYFRVYRPGGSGCMDTSGIFKLTVNLLPAPPITAITNAFCPGDSIEICAPGNFTSYKWNNGSNTNCTFAKTTGGYWVSVTDANGCSVISERKNMSIYPSPTISVLSTGDTLSSFGGVTYQWYRNGSEITGATDSIYIITQAGIYAVQVTDMNGCKAVSPTVSYTGISNIAENDFFAVYPNPSSGVINVYFKAVNGQKTDMVVLNTLGERVIEFNIQSGRQTSLDLSALPKGMYILQVQSTSQSYTRKIIIQ